MRRTRRPVQQLLKSPTWRCGRRLGTGRRPGTGCWCQYDSTPRPIDSWWWRGRTCRPNPNLRLPVLHNSGTSRFLGSESTHHRFLNLTRNHPNNLLINLIKKTAGSRPAVFLCAIAKLALSTFLVFIAQREPVTRFDLCPLTDEFFPNISRSLTSPL